MRSGRGGEKYIYNGILFKFAIDWKGIYSGDEYAMKAAAHEMRSLTAFYNYGQPIGLRVPLITLINYLGFRLVALSILPVSRHTIVYGSCDGGQTVHKSHARVAQLMKRVAKRLNLKKHKAGVDVELTKSLPYPCDIETHVGRDNRFYTLGELLQVLHLSLTYRCRFCSVNAADHPGCSVSNRDIVFDV